MRTPSSIEKTLKAGHHDRGYNCDDCGWAENAAELRTCSGCGLKLVCEECCDEMDHCVECTAYDLPSNIILVGQSAKCDVEFTIHTWIGLCSASHYYLVVQEPLRGNGNFDIATTKYQVTNISRLANIIRAVLKRLATQYPYTTIRASIDFHEARRPLIKYGPLDGD